VLHAVFLNTARAGETEKKDSGALAAQGSTTKRRKKMKGRQNRCASGFFLFRAESGGEGRRCIKEQYRRTYPDLKGKSSREHILRRDLIQLRLAKEEGGKKKKFREMDLFGLTL